MAVLEVGTNKKYKTIRAAILTAVDNDLINVYPGTYEESFEITKKIIMQGVTENSQINSVNPIVINNSEVPLFFSSDCEVNNISFTTNCTNKSIIAISSNAKFSNCVFYSGKETGIASSYKANPSFYNCQINHNKIGLSGANFTIHNCEINHNSLIGISITTKQKENRAIIELTNINNSYVGIFINKKASVSLNKCKIHDCETNGITLTDKSKIILNECQINFCEEGINFTDKSSGILCDSKICKNKVHGVFISKSADVIIQNCDLYKNSNLGLFLSDEAFVRVYDSKIHDNKENSIIAYDASTFTINHSEVFNNGDTLYEIEENTIWTEAFPKSVKKHVQKILPKVNKEDLEIIKMYFGLDEKPIICTISEVSLYFNIPVKRVITIIEKVVSLAMTSQNSWS